MKTYADDCREIGIGMPPMIWKDSGVYSISCATTGKRYIGCSKNIIRRLKIHVNNLKKGKHCNRKLQNAWNKYGQDSFYASVIKYTDNTFAEEVHWIKVLDGFGEGFNLTTGGDGVHLLDPVSQSVAREKTNEKLRTDEARGRVGSWSSSFHKDNKEKMAKVLSENATSGWSKLSPEERTARANRVWATRRANAQK